MRTLPPFSLTPFLLRTVLLLGACLVAGAVSPRAARGQSDTLAPQLEAFSFVPDEVDAVRGDGRITVTVRLTDDLSGVSNFRVVFEGPSGQSVAGSFNADNARVSGNALDGVYKGTVRIAQYSEAGTWHVAQVSVTDNVSNRTVVSEAQLAAQGEPTTVEVGAFEPTLATPVPLSPADGAVDQPRKPVFAWAAVAGAQAYHLQVSSAEDFTTLAYQRSSITETTLEGPSFSYGATYFWRVQAMNEAGDSYWSDTLRFTTTAAPPAAAPVNLVPANGTVDYTAHAVFAWSPTAGATGYHVQVKREGVLVVDQPGLVDTSYAMLLDYGTRYTWRVRASNPGGEGPWTLYQRIDTGIGVASEPGAETPAAFALGPAYPNPFNPQTTLVLSVGQVQRVTVRVYDVRGREVAVLYRGILPAGAEHRLRFEAGGLPGGVYFVRATGERMETVQAVTLLK